MDQKYQDAFKNSQDKIGSYLRMYGTPEKCSARVNELYNYLVKNNAEVIAILFAQATPMLAALKMNPENEIKVDHEIVQSVIKMLLFMLDSMDYADYLDIKFLSPEVKVKKYGKEINLHFPQSMFKKVEEDNKKKDDKK